MGIGKRKGGNVVSTNTLGLQLPVQQDYLNLEKEEGACPRNDPQAVGRMQWC